MAQRVQVVLTDDIDGGEGAETVSFSYNGVDYELDRQQRTPRNSMTACSSTLTTAADSAVAPGGAVARARPPR